ncbi:MAG: AEC family transporter [Desulfarculaceae bacterium]
MNHILDNVLPVFLLIALGQALSRWGLASEAFYKASDRLVYFIFFPALLFWKISQAFSLPSQLADFYTWQQLTGVLAAVVTVWAATLVYIRLAKIPAFQAGTFSQVSYRFNTYVGMAVVIGTFGEPGAASFGMIISLAIPLINLLAVATLVWFSQSEIPLAQKIKLVTKAIILNPLILACAAGIAYGSAGLGLPVFAGKTLSLLSSITLPMALLSIGGGLQLAKLKGHMRLSLLTCLFKLFILPAVGFVFLWGLGVRGLPFQTAMVYFALPTSTASYILSSQLKSDQDLATAAIVMSTLLSFISLSLALVLFA